MTRDVTGTVSLLKYTSRDLDRRSPGTGLIQDGHFQEVQLPWILVAFVMRLEKMSEKGSDGRVTMVTPTYSVPLMQLNYI